MASRKARLGCLFAVLLLLIVVGGFFGIYQWGKASLSPVCEKFLAFAESGDFKSAYEMTSSGFKRSTPYEEYEKFEKALRNALGKCLDKKVTRVHLSARTGEGRIVEISYDTTFENGSCSMTFKLHRESNEWKIFRQIIMLILLRNYCVALIAVS